MKKKKLKRNWFCNRRKHDARDGNTCSGFSSNWLNTDARCLNCKSYMENYNPVDKNKEELK